MLVEFDFMNFCHSTDLERGVW